MRAVRSTGPDADCGQRLEQTVSSVPCYLNRASSLNELRIASTSIRVVESIAGAGSLTNP